MIKQTRALVSAALAAAIMMLSPLPAVALDDADKEELGQFIREYLIQNPEILFEVQAAYEAKQQDVQREQAKQLIADAQDAIFNSSHDIILGNPDGDVTIVEFFDYNCGYCKRAMKDMEEIIANDSNVRFVLKEFPILGDESVAAHRVSMALTKVAPEKYEEFHFELLGVGSAQTKPTPLRWQRPWVSMKTPCVQPWTANPSPRVSARPMSLPTGSAYPEHHPTLSVTKPCSVPWACRH